MEDRQTRLARSATLSWKKPLIAVVGGLLVLLGAVLLLLPGPGLVVLAAGMSLLATEFVWARRQLRRFRDWLRRKRL